jgi:hypothetical protein
VTEYTQDPLPGMPEASRAGEARPGTDERALKLRWLVQLLLDPASDSDRITELRKELGL